MDDADPRVKELQNLAWSLQSMSNKPGSRLQEVHKRAAYSITSQAITLCTDAVYTAEADFVERAAVLTKRIEAKKLELQEVEEAENQKLAGKCYRASADGGYVVGEKAGVKREEAAADPQAALTTSRGTGGPHAPSVRSDEVVARCTDNPAVLQLARASLTDCDLDALVDGLRRAGSGVTTLDLSHNAIADAGVQRLVGALAGGLCPQLQQLRLQGNPLGPLGTQMVRGGLCALRRGLQVELETPPEAEGAALTGAAVSEDMAPTLVDEAAAALEVPPEEQGAAVAEDMAPTLVEEAAAVALGVASQEQGAAAAEDTAPTLVEEAAAALEVASEEQGAAPLLSGPAPALDRQPVEISEAASQVRVTVPVPEGLADSAQELELDISLQRLVIRGRKGAVLADAGLPCSVDPGSAQAAFSRKKRMVAVTLLRTVQ